MYLKKVTQATSDFQAKVVQLTKAALTVPFELARQNYAAAVKLGIIPSSMLASRDFHKFVSTAEQASLGAWARTRD